MVYGNDAAAAGMAVLDGSEDRRNGWDEINRTRDYIAQRTSTVQPIAKGGTGATTAAGARSALGVQTTVDAVAGATDAPSAGKIAKYDAGGRLATNTPSASNDAANKAYVDGAVPSSVNGMSGGSIGSGVAVQGDLSCTGLARAIGSRGFQVSSSYVSAYMDGNGFFGFAPSAARLKQDEAPHPYSLDDACRLEVVSYRLRTAVESDPDAPAEVGVIAEQLLEAGLGEFVLFDDAGRTQSVAYERLALVALSALREVRARLEDLEARVSYLEPAGA